jgi:acetyl-CoA carboxylase biotin carboxyl carrier protein
MASKASPIDPELIRTLADLLTESDLSEIEIEQDDFRIRVARTRPQQHVQVAAPAPAQPVPGAATVATAAAPAAGGGDLVGPGTLTSPMVGTAYMSGEPGTAPYVEIGDAVTEGQTVLIVEAMKTMNQIPAHRAGTITRILVEDAQPVEFGEPLLVIE